MATGKTQKAVFVGNIPYDMAEEQVIEIFKEVGPVVGFKLMFDKETGKARGYGFCEFADSETAQSAIRNLNGYDVGGRTLRVGWADQETTSIPSVNQQQNMLQQQPISSNPILAPTGIPSVDTVNATLASMSNVQILEVINQLKVLSLMRLIDPTTIQQVLTSPPFSNTSALPMVPPTNASSGTIPQGQVPSAIPLQIQVPSVTNIPGHQIHTSQTSAPHLPPHPIHAGRPTMPPPSSRNAPIPPGMLPHIPPSGMMPPQIPLHQGILPHPPPPPVPHQLGLPPRSNMIHPGVPPHRPPYSNPPQQSLPTSHQQQTSPNPDQQRALIVQIMNMTPEQINALPPQQREQVLQLRAQVSAASAHQHRS